MIVTRTLLNAFAAMALLAAHGNVAAAQAACPKSAATGGSGTAQIRPDLDKHDRERDARFPMDTVLDSLGIDPGMSVAEIGAGWGYLSFKLARRVAPDGLVLAEDISQHWLDTLKTRAAERGLTNIRTLLGKETDPLLPSETLDFIFMHAVLNWIENRPEYLRKLGSALKADGRLVIIEPETEGSDPEAYVVDAYGFPTRQGYMELFRRAGFEVVSAERKPDWTWTVFVLKKKPARSDRNDPASSG